MKNPVFDALTRAIDGRQLVMVTDEAGVRLIEPYLIFESASGDMLLHGWQRSGAFRTTPPPRFCNLHLDDIHTARIAAEHFEHPHADYNARSGHFHRVIYALPDQVAVQPKPPPAERGPAKPRRRPPPREAGDSPRNSWPDRSG